MAEIKFNNIYDQMSGTVKNSYDGAFMGQSFADQYDPTKRVANIDEDTGQPTGTFTDSNSNSLTMKDGYTQMVDAYNQEQQSKTKNSFLSSLANFGSADASEMIPTNGLQTNSMMGMTINPDGSLNYNNEQPQNLGFRSMVDMANNVNNFDSQFSYPASQGIDTSMYGADQDIYGIKNARGLFRPSQQSTDFNTKYSPDGITNYDFDEQPEEAIYQDRSMNNNLPSYGYEPSKRFKDHSSMKSFLRANPDMGQNIKDKIGSVFNQGKQGILNNKLVKGAGMAFNAATGNIPGLIMGGIGMLGNQFADKTLYGDTIDEYGNVYSADQLNKMNAAGGGYTDPARSARRRVNRIRKMKERRDTDRRYSKNNLRILQEQEAAAQQARLTATRSMARDNSKDNTGGYQAGYGSSFMDGSGTAAEMGSSAMGGIIGHGGTGGRPAQSGLASMFTRRR